MILETVELIIQSVGFAREIFGLFTPKSPEDEGSKVNIIHESKVVHERQIVRERTHIVREKILDEEALRHVIDQTNQHLKRLLEVQGRQILAEMRRQRVQEAIQEVQARVSALKSLTGIESESSESESGIALQLVIGALNPLQVSLEVAKLRLQEYGQQEEIWQFCYIVGTSALLSGYAYLGQDMAHMRAELKETIYRVQREILNKAATKLLSMGKEIPWEQVPRLLLPEGVEDLAQLYRSATENEIEAEASSTHAKSPQKSRATSSKAKAMRTRKVASKYAKSRRKQ